jgi:hypothetical protein
MQFPGGGGCDEFCVVIAPFPFAPGAGADPGKYVKAVFVPALQVHGKEPAVHGSIASGVSELEPENTCTDIIFIIPQRGPICNKGKTYFSAIIYGHLFPAAAAQICFFFGKERPAKHTFRWKQEIFDSLKHR